jgi:phosphoglycolate phosphatase
MVQSVGHSRRQNQIRRAFPPALQREIKEETNLDIGDIVFVMAQDCIQSKEFYRRAHFVLLNYTCRARGPVEVRLNEEAQEFRWVTAAQALECP